MFYSDTLLSKTGALAHVWLAANMERKLSKKDYVTSKLEDSIQVMVNESSAPMALRLSGQLLLGVVRIYKKKTSYLLDDCNEALLKIKMVSTRLFSTYDAQLSPLLLSRSTSSMAKAFNCPLLSIF
jgi:cohesin complex subunit SCC1